MNQATVTVEKQVRSVYHGKVIADLLEDLEMTTIDFAKKLDVSAETVEGIVQDRIPVTVDMAIRLGKGLGNGPQLWLNLQQKVDIWDTMQERTANYNKVCSVN
jgi:addiction module HigA family antidote